MGTLGMKLTLLFLLFLTVKAQHKLNAYNRGGLLIYCKYNDEFKDKEKYLCRGNAHKCLHNYQNRTVMYQNINRVYATILMKNLTSKDEGIYHCASEGGRVHSSCDVTVKEGDCSDLPIRISAHEGENINVTCKCPNYKSANCPRNIKHFCKENKDFIESGLIELKSSSVKYSLTENSSANTFNVTIYKLEMKDAGTYWCGFRTGGENIALTAQVNLLITGRLEEVRGVVGGGVAIVCKFDDPDQLNQKQRFFCKGNASTCPYNGLSSTDNNRVALYRGAYGDFLTIVMKKLTENDSGTYYCAENGEARTKVQLNIDDGDYCDTPPKIKVKNKGDNVTIQCTYPVEYQGKKKYFCKEGGGTMRMDLLKSRPSYSNLKYSVSEDKTENLFTVTIYNLDMYDTATYWCGMGSGGQNVALFTKVELNVLDSGMKPTDDAVGQAIKTGACVVTTLLVAAAFFLCYIKRQQRKQENSNAVNLNSTITQLDAVYESLNPNTMQQIGSVHPILSANTMEPDADYQSLNPNTNQPDADYQSLNPNTTQPDAVYQSLNPNTTQPDAIYQKLNHNTTQPDAVYQSLKTDTLQPDAVYQSLNPNTTQTDADYLNTNTTQPDADYQSLNPNTTQPDADYQSLNPNTTQPDADYQSLNPNTNQPDADYVNDNTTQPDAFYQRLNANTIQPDTI